MWIRGWIVLVAAALGVTAALPSSAANVALVDHNFDLVSPVISDTVILENTWRVETDEAPTSWGWSFECTGCQIVAYNVNSLAGVLPPSSGSDPVDWWGDFSIISSTLLSFSNDGNVAGTMGGANVAGSSPPGTGVDVLVGWITIHVTAQSGTVTPFFSVGDGIYEPPDAQPVPTSFSGVSWTPEPRAALLLTLAMMGLGVVRRGGR